jgi:transposase
MSRRVGIDLALRGTHKAVVLDGTRAVGRPFTVSMDRVGMERLLERAMAGVAEVSEFVLEPTGNAWLVPSAWLIGRGQRVVIAQGKKTSDLRKFYRRHVKSDVVDAETMGRLPELDRRGCHRLALPPTGVLSLRRLVKQRERFVRQATVSKQRVLAVLELAHPHLLAALGEDRFTSAARAFLGRYLDPFRVKRLGRNRLVAFLARHNRRRRDPELAERVWEACVRTWELYGELRDACRLPCDYEQLQDEVNRELQTAAFAEGNVAELDKKIEGLYLQIDPAQSLRQLPGIGPTIAPSIEALVAGVGRFRNARAFVSYCGLCPRHNQTGLSRREGMPVTKAGQRLLKKYLYLAAEVARRKDPVFAAKYAALEARGKHHTQIVIALAHMLARRVYAVLKRRDAASFESVPYELRTTDGQPINVADATRLIAERYPSKRERQRREQETRAASKSSRGPRSEGGSAAPACSGQSEDSTIQAYDTLPLRAILDELRRRTKGRTTVSDPVCGKPVNDLRIARSRSDQEGLDKT